MAAQPSQSRFCALEANFANPDLLRAEHPSPDVDTREATSSAHESAAPSNHQRAIAEWELESKQKRQASRAATSLEQQHIYAYNTRFRFTDHVEIGPWDSAPPAPPPSPSQNRIPRTHPQIEPFYYWHSPSTCESYLGARPHSYSMTHENLGRDIDFGMQDAAIGGGETSQVTNSHGLQTVDGRHLTGMPTDVKSQGEELATHEAFASKDHDESEDEPVGDKEYTKSIDKGVDDVLNKCEKFVDKKIDEVVETHKKSINGVVESNFGNMNASTSYSPFQPLKKRD